jgi:cysteine-rich repeat protein
MPGRLPGPNLDLRRRVLRAGGVGDVHRRLLVTAIASGLAGCIEPSLVTCADGRACPSGQACDDVHHSCVSPDQLVVCDGAADLTPCQTTRIPDGVCFGGICLPAGCGNAELEPGELCDDGNLVSGDGCSADCRSREVCGDGFADPTLGEACDDGNTLGRDGCAPGCAEEHVIWGSQDYTIPHLRTDSAIVYDPLRRVVVAFGGQDYTSATPSDLADTWEWNGGQWREVTPLGSPPARHGHSLAYDPRRHRIVMFGGSSLMFGELDDTWEYDGATWQSKDTTSGPLGREGAAMAWDPVVGRIVLFGGRDGETYFADTWTWDGTGWTQLEPPAPPPARAHAGLAYDAAGDRLLLFGGAASATSYLTDTWSFDGTTWSPVTAATPATNPIIAIPTMVYDPIRAVPLAVVTTGPPTTEEVWALSGGSWQRLNATVGSGGSFAFDIAHDRILAWAGTTFGRYEYDVGWTAVSVSTGAGPRATSVAYDPVRARVVLFAGNPTLVSDTWEWDGVQWTRRSTTGPPDRFEQAMAYDGASRRVLVFGGQSSAPVVIYGDTWAWDGTTWSEVTPAPPASSPSPRELAAMTYDSVRQRVVLFGGIDGNNVVLNDTWEWDGAAWHDATPLVGSPPPMGVMGAYVAFGWPAMVFDVARRRTVLFGGYPTGQTWEWDGSTWTPHLAGPTDLLPTAAWSPALVYDTRRARTVLTGGSPTSTSLWEWDGSHWSQPDVGSISPSPRIQVAAAYDEARGQLVRYGGGNGFGGQDGVTWIGAYVGPDEEICDSGVDVDRDGKIGCADEDCAAACRYCGDGACNAAENDRLCPADCPATPAICGDAYCAPSESAAMCAADCAP